MKILIVSSFFPPQNSIASLRPYSWAKYWSRMGHEVTVLTVPKAPQPSDSTMTIEGFSVHYVEAPFLAKRASVPTAVRQQEADSGVLEKKPSLFRRVARQLVASLSSRYGVLYSCRFPDVMDLWAAKAKLWAARQSWDIVVSTGGPYSVHRIALHIKQQSPQTKWILDWRDLWTQNHFFRGIWFFRPYERMLERRFHRHADLVTTVSEPLAELLKKVGADTVTTIYNGFDPDDYASLSVEHFFGSDGVFRIVYSGTIYAGRQDPTLLFRAVAKLAASGKITPAKVRLVFAGANADPTEIARRCGVEEYVEYLGFLPRAQALQMQRDADMLLFLGLKDHDNKGILTGKLFEYLYVNKVVLALDVTRDSEIGEMFLDSGSYVIENQSQLENVIQNELDRPSIRKGFATAITQYSREYQAELMLNSLEYKRK